MAKVDPFVIKWPSQWLSDREIEPVIRYLNRFLHDLWLRSGGGEDLVDNTQQEVTSSSSRISRNAAKINALEKVAFDVEIITSDFTTSRNQIVVCKNTSAITVTLDPLAIEEDQVHIKRKQNAARVTVVGLIDGKTSTIINIKKFSLHLVFDGTEWSQI